MTNSTIPNVPRVLLELASNLAFQTQHYPLHEDLRAILSAPSPAGVDGLEVFITDCATCIDVVPAKTVTDARVVLAKDAQAIIDGLRGEVAEQEETANQWRELALQFDRHRMTAMAHIRAAASGDKSAIEALGVFAALPPIPGHEITAAIDQQAQRTGELEAALDFACKALAQVTSSDGSGHADIAVSVLRMAGTKDADALHVVEAYKAGAKWRIDAALSAGKVG